MTMKKMNEVTVPVNGLETINGFYFRAKMYVTKIKSKFSKAIRSSGRT